MRETDPTLAVLEREVNASTPTLDVLPEDPESDPWLSDVHERPTLIP